MQNLKRYVDKWRVREYDNRFSIMQFEFKRWSSAQIMR